MTSEALLRIEGVSKSFRLDRREVRAVAEVDLEVRRGECLALVGESGSGKTTLARCILGLYELDAGRVVFAGNDLATLAPKELRQLRRRFQMVFQGNSEAFDPRQRVESILAEPLQVHRLAARREIPGRVAELLDRVGLAPSLSARYPHQLSGGQRQRLGIARALATEPELLVLDEPVSALDVSVRAQILQLLVDLRERMGLTMVLISHDLAVVDQVADRVAVVYLGKIVELGPRQAILEAPRHPYTAALLESVPRLDPARARRRGMVSGEPASPLSPPPGCAFHPRCRQAQGDSEKLAFCQRRPPELEGETDGHLAACFHPLEKEANLLGEGLGEGRRSVSR